MKISSLLLSVLAITNGMTAFSGDTNPRVWSKLQVTQPSNSARKITVSSSLIYRLDIDGVKKQLDGLYAAGSNATTPVLLSLPLPDGEMVEFSIVRNSAMHPDLAAKYPSIRTFDGKAVKRPGMVAKIDYTPQGFHAMILHNDNTVFIDPYEFGGANTSDYLVYNKSDFYTDKEFNCEHSGESSIDLGDDFTSKVLFGSCELRKYRLALSATGEYTVFQGGTVERALAAQVTTMNRVNGIYERDMAITMEIIANNDLLIYTNPASDPYTNGEPDYMISENQNNVTTLIGSSNYDIGHVFGTNSGGLAGLGVVCKSTSKARGVTGSSAPVNDPFDIDYVAHEMGHQFGANHTFNNSCGGNRNSSTAVEPGSGSTIMAYAGICAPNVQSNSNDYFHGISLKEISNFILTSGHNCPVKVPLNNSAPQITSTGSASYIPKGTPFSLTATASDADGDPLTYCWEQMNPEISTQAPVATATRGPNFRSFSPQTSPTRNFPSIEALVSNSFTWERLPSVTRTMKFRVTVRDNASGGGCADYSDMTLNVADSGPFVVLYPSDNGVVWEGNTTETVRWDVAGTDAAPVSCEKVDILISTDLGESFTVLKSQTPNDGSETVTVPNVATTKALIMVRSESGTFFDLSDKRFKINASTASVSETVASQIKLYPNPSAGLFTLEIPEGISAGQINVTDQLGRIILKVEKQETQQVEIDLSGEAGGFYFVQMNINGQALIQKIIKQ